MRNGSGSGRIMALFATVVVMAWLLTGCRSSRDSIPVDVPNFPLVRAPEHAVGYTVLDVKVGDAALPVAVWYPTGATEQDFKYPTTGESAKVALDGPAKKGPWPLLVLSHGFSGGGLGSSGIAERIARYGWVVAAPDHSDPVMSVRIRGGEKGNLLKALHHLRDKPPTRANYGYRIRELAAVADALAKERQLQVDPEHLALAGHSMGGWTVMNLLLDGFAGVDAAVFYSMGELQWLYRKERFFESEAFQRLGVPAMYLYGSEEERANERGVYSAFAFEKSPSPACLLEVPGGNHFVYNDRTVAPRSGGSVQQFDVVAQATVSFLEKYVLGKDVPVIAERCR